MSITSEATSLEDPAAPQSDDEKGAHYAVAIEKANIGETGPQLLTMEVQLDAPILTVHWNDVSAFLLACETSVPRVHYGLGAKIPSISAVPGVDFTKVDCSGFVRAAVMRATHPTVNFPDGSVTQHDWIKSKSFAPTTIDEAQLVDGKVRIGFLEPQDSGEHIGHVVLIRNGKTAESHGGVGPDSRPFNGTGWQAKAKLYLLSN